MMCGIAGFCNFKRDNTQPQWSVAGHRMGEALNHRGQDDKGIYLCRDGGLVHRRQILSDPERGHQPMIRRLEGAEFAIVCDAALSPSPALRGQLRELGYHFSTTADAETLLYAYAAFGEGVASYLAGAFAFAFAIWDGARRRFFLCRDGLGAAPLCYGAFEDTFLFASEPIALTQYPGLEHLNQIDALTPGGALVISPEGVRPAGAVPHPC